MGKWAFRYICIGSFTGLTWEMILGFGCIMKGKAQRNEMTEGIRTEQGQAICLYHTSQPVKSDSQATVVIDSLKGGICFWNLIVLCVMVVVELKHERSRWRQWRREFVEEK